MKARLFSTFVFGLMALALVAGCGKQAGPGVTIQSNPLAGPNAASLWRIFDSLIGIPSAYAAVQPFTTFKMCVGEVVWEFVGGQPGSSNVKLKPGLLDFSPSSQDVMVIGTLDVPSGSALKNIKFTIEKVPSLCANANYAVLFNAGSGDKQVEQNTSFKFEFGSGGRTVSDGDVVTLYLGEIVNAMVALGNSLNDSTIQTITAGQAK